MKTSIMLALLVGSAAVQAAVLESPKAPPGDAGVVTESVKSDSVGRNSSQPMPVVQPSNQQEAPLVPDAAPDSDRSPPRPAAETPPAVTPEESTVLARSLLKTHDFSAREALAWSMMMAGFFI